MSRRSIALSCVWMALMMTMGCSWDDGLYKKFVNSEGEYAFCPSRNQESESREDGNYLAYIVIDSPGESDDTDDDKLICCNPDPDAEINNEDIDCVSSAACEKYADSFKYNICPRNFGCSDKGKDAYCYPKIECPENQILCDGKCIIPESDREYCGAKGECNSAKKSNDNFRGVKCDDDMQCDGGTCGCLKGLIRCDEKCIDPMNHMDYCGATDCSDENKKGENCYKVKAGGTVSNYCKDGVCVDVECIPGYHLDNGKCLKDDLKNCGAIGRVCEAEGWKSGRCSDGECILEECIAGYHKIANVCIKDSINACGQSAVSCYEKIPGLESGECKDGECIIGESGKCQSGYHLYEEGNLCEPDSPSNCGEHDNGCDRQTQVCAIGDESMKTDCVSINNCSETLCDYSCVDTKKDSMNCGGCNVSCNNEDKCKTDKCKCDNSLCVCKDNYIECNGNCILPVDVHHCGSCGNDCGNDKNVTCTLDRNTGNYECVCQGLAFNPETKTCVNNQSDTRTCGSEFRDCGKINNAQSTKCENGRCVVLQCKNKYHISKSGDACEENTVSSCAALDSSSAVDCNYLYWENASCNNGKCFNNKCAYDGYFINNQCIRFKAWDTVYNMWAEEAGLNRNCNRSDFQRNIDVNASTIYCMSGRYWGWDILDCKAGYHKQKIIVNEDWCRDAFYICYQENSKLYVNKCVKD